MTRKDYITLAEVLQVEYHVTVSPSYETVGAQTVQAIAKDTIIHLAGEMADSLQRHNARFNREHFLAVVRGEKDLNSRPGRS